MLGLGTSQLHVKYMFVTFCYSTYTVLTHTYTYTYTCTEYCNLSWFYASDHHFDSLLFCSMITKVSDRLKSATENGSMDAEAAWRAHSIELVEVAKVGVI